MEQPELVIEHNKTNQMASVFFYSSTRARDMRTGKSEKQHSDQAESSLS